MIERIQRLPIRSIWRYEDRDFTVWLSENIDVLKDVIGEELTNAEREQSTGNFHVDIKAEDESGDVVVIENQLTKSDHDHLGKLITYMSTFNAKKAIWIVTEPRQEHINAVNWLNEGNNCDFYLLKIEAIKIGDSNAAPLITKIVGPSDESKKVGKIKKEDSERHELRLKFWTKLLDYSKAKHKLFNSISPSKDTWIGVTSGIRGIQYCYWLNQFGIRIELRIDRGKDSEDENLKILHHIKTKREEIEENFGSELIWDELEGYRVCAVRKQFDNGGYKSPEDEWEKIIEIATTEMDKLQKATKDILKEIKTGYNNV